MGDDFETVRQAIYREDQDALDAVERIAGQLASERARADEAERLLSAFTDVTRAKFATLTKVASEAMWWMEAANEPDDENQTKEQYRLMTIDLLRQALNPNPESETGG